MLNNYDATLTALAAFLVANAPRGADRDLIRLQDQIGRGEVPDYMHLEFKPAQDVGCTLYVRVESPEGKYDRARIMDEAGNRWYAYAVKCEVSWCSWGSGDVVTTQRRLACMTEVTRLACEVERVFSTVFHRLDATADEIKAQEAKYAKDRAVSEIKSLVISHAKGMKVGDTKSVGIRPEFDLTGVGEVQVERKEGGRTFKYSASPECAGLVYFMRLES